MKIGILVPSLFTERKFFPKLIFAPHDLGVALANGLVEKGHQVRYYGASSVKTKADLVAGDSSLFANHLAHYGITAHTFKKKQPESFRIMQTYYEMGLAEKAYMHLEKGELDVVHHFHDFLSLFITSFTKPRSLITLHDPLPGMKDKISKRAWLFQKHCKANYVSISRAQRRPMPNLNYVGTAYNGIDTDEYVFNDTPRDYLAFIGRFERVKGVHTAIQVAKKLDMRLRVAGDYFGRHKTVYFKKNIEPYFGKKIQRAGFVMGQDKIEFLKHAKAILFPIEWEEPFGMVMIEAMSCGTPVIAYDRGSVPEIIKDGVTGFIVKDRAGMIEAVKKIDQIKRKNCRKRVEQMFSEKRMVEKYEVIYKRVIERGKKI